MSEHPNAVLARQITDLMNRGETEALEGLVADDVVWHAIGRSEPIRGKGALRAEMSEGDYQITYRMHDVIANDDHTVVLGEATATRGGKTFVYRTAEIFHIRDGKLAERWAFSDDTAAIVAFFA